MDQSLLEEAQPFCDAATGEVLQRMPEELMQRLRTAKMAVGVGGRPSAQTGSTATWFVFLNDEIRQQAMALHQQARAYGRSKRKRQPPKPVGKSSRGLGEFTRRRKSAK